MDSNGNTKKTQANLDKYVKKLPWGRLFLFFLVSMVAKCSLVILQVRYVNSAPAGTETLLMIDHAILAIDIISVIVFSMSVIPKVIWYIRLERQLTTEGAKPISSNYRLHAAPWAFSGQLIATSWRVCLI